MGVGTVGAHPALVAGLPNFHPIACQFRHHLRAVTALYLSLHHTVGGGHILKGDFVDVVVACAVGAKVGDIGISS